MCIERELNNANAERLRLEARVKDLECRSRQVLDLVREAGDCNMLGRAGDVRERLGKVSVMLQKMGGGNA